MDGSLNIATAGPGGDNTRRKGRKKMTIANRIKGELLNAEINYTETLERYRKDHPYGVNFCGDTVPAKSASDAGRLYAAENAYNALYSLVSPKRAATPENIRVIINAYINAENDAAIEAAEKAYYKLFAVK